MKGWIHPYYTHGGCWWSIDSWIGVEQITEGTVLGVISPCKPYTSIHKYNHRLVHHAPFPRTLNKPCVMFISISVVCACVRLRGMQFRNLHFFSFWFGERSDMCLRIRNFPVVSCINVLIILTGFWRFGLFKKRGTLIRMCLNEKCSKFIVDKNLTDTFRIYNCLTRDAFFSLL
jgi:hypothetical protein